MASLAGQEKAVLGGLGAGVLALLGQLGVNGNLTVKEGVYAVVSWLGTHFVVWLVTNSPKPVQTIVKDAEKVAGVENPTPSA